MRIRIPLAIVVALVAAAPALCADPEKALLDRFRKKNEERPQVWKQRIEQAVDASKSLEKENPDRAAESLRQLMADAYEDVGLTLDQKRDIAQQLRQRLDDLLFSTLSTIPRGPGVVVGNPMPPDAERLAKLKTGDPALVLLYDGTIFPPKVIKEETKQVAELNYITSRWVLLTLNYRKTWMPSWQVNAVHVPQGVYIYDYDYLYFRFLKNSETVEMALAGRPIFASDYAPLDDPSAEGTHPLVATAFRAFPKELRPTAAQLRRAMNARLGVVAEGYVEENLLLNQVRKFRPDYAGDAVTRAMPNAEAKWIATARRLHAEYIDIATTRRELTPTALIDELSNRLRRTHPVLTRDEAERIAEAISSSIAVDRQSRPR